MMYYHCCNDNRYHKQCQRFHSCQPPNILHAVAGCQEPDVKRHYDSSIFSLNLLGAKRSHQDYLATPVSCRQMRKATSASRLRTTPNANLRKRRCIASEPARPESPREVGGNFLRMAGFRMW